LNRAQFDEAHPRWVVRRSLGGYLHSQPRLTNARWSRQRQQACTLEQPPNLGNFGRAANEAGQLYRKIVLGVLGLPLTQDARECRIRGAPRFELASTFRVAFQSIECLAQALWIADTEFAAFPAGNRIRGDPDRFGK
jgi:hypothetical protein